MNLRFNKGAIVVLSIRGLNNPTTVMGKVVNVFPDEVEICPQAALLEDGKLLPDYTADCTYTIHIRRELIWNWRYARASDFEYQEKINCKLILDKTMLNVYALDGYCKGTGPSFANIKEESTSSHMALIEDDGK